MGLPMPADMAASSGSANPLPPFMAPPTLAGSSGAAHQSAAMPDMPSDINMEEARCEVLPTASFAMLTAMYTSRFMALLCSFDMWIGANRRSCEKYVCIVQLPKPFFTVAASQQLAAVT